jgi:hypothetical protein
MAKGNTRKSTRRPREPRAIGPGSITDGDDLFPWPWRAAWTLLSQANRQPALLADNPEIDSTPARCREVLASVVWNSPLPDTKAFSVFLIRGIVERRVSNAEAEPIVAFPPEFLFLFDLGYESLAAVDVSWDPRISGHIYGYGDARFPDLSNARTLSIKEESRTALLYPCIAGELVVGLVNGITALAAKQALESHGVKDVQISETIATARCSPFFERKTCAMLEREIPAVVRYAEPNRVVRLVDLPWSVVRIA